MPVPNQVYQSEHQRLIAVTPLQGVEFEDDNGRVFDLLKSWTLNGPAWTWMRAHNGTRNGRQAWLALVDHFEGDAQRDRVKDNAYAAIAAAKYYGERKKFTFETYVAIHQDAYSDLEQYEVVISEEKRVRDLLTNIKDTSTAASAVKGTILATPHLRNNFANAVAHLSTTLQLGQSMQEPRNISSTQSGRGPSNQNQYQSGRGRGGRGNKQRGRGRGRGGRNIYLGSYAPNDWRNLSSEDKKRVIDGRAKSAAASAAASNNSNNQGGGRQIASVTYADDGSTLGPSTPANMDNAVLQGVLQGSAAIGEKRSNSESAGSQMSRRRVNALVTTNRTSHPWNISRIAYRQYQSIDNTITGTSELDSHADTCVAGANCVIIEETHQTEDVSAYSEELGTLKNIPIVTAATAYDDPATGTTYILILGQAIYMGDKMQHTLICPNQLRARGLIADDCPRHLSPRDNPSSHSIYDPDEDFRLPLSLKGVTSYFTSRTPTAREIETCKWITLSDDQEWDPHSQGFQEQEENFTCHSQFLPYGQEQDRTLFELSSKVRYKFQKVNYSMEHSNISQAFDDKYIIAATATSNRECNQAAEDLASSWGIGIETARKTLKSTTQKGMRHTLYPIERRFRTRQAQLRYSQMSGRHGRFYTDTFFANTPTLNGSTMAQLYINDLSFNKVYPMKAKSETVDTLRKFIQDVGIPHAIHSDDALELMQGKFKQTCEEFGIGTTYTEPYIPWQNRAEGGIRELKRHIHRKMTSKRVPQRLWDFCPKWSCEIKNKTARNLYALEDRTPFEATIGETPDISSLLSFDFYDPVWYYDETAAFQAPKRQLGRWLGEAKDFGQAMCYWVLSDTAKPIVHSTVQPIPKDKLTLAETQSQLQALDQIISDKLGSPSSTDSIYPYDLEPEGQIQADDDFRTPEYSPIEPESRMPEADDWDTNLIWPHILYYGYYSVSLQGRLVQRGTKVQDSTCSRNCFCLLCTS